MDKFLDKLFNNEVVYAVRDFFSFIAEKIENTALFNRTPSKKFLLTGFGVIIGVLVLVSTAFVIADNREEQEEATTDAVSETQMADVTLQSTKEIDASFLLALTDDDSKVHSIIVAKFNSEEESLTMEFVDPSVSVTVNDSPGSIQEHLINGGISEFLWAISEHTGQGFNRYFIGDEDSFTSLLSMLGETEVDIPEQVYYDHDGISFIIDRGPQKLTSDMMLKYYLYLISSPEKNSEHIRFVITDILSRLFTAETDELLEQRFCKAIGLFTTDISAIDFSEHKDAIKRIPSMFHKDKTEE